MAVFKSGNPIIVRIQDNTQISFLPIQIRTVMYFIAVVANFLLISEKS